MTLLLLDFDRILFGSLSRPCAEVTDGHMRFSVCGWVGLTRRQVFALALVVYDAQQLSVVAWWDTMRDDWACFQSRP